jgi:hypothetical protein
MSNEHDPDEPAIHPDPLGKPEPLSEVIRDVAKNVAGFLGGDKPEHDEEDGPVEGSTWSP